MGLEAATQVAGPEDRFVTLPFEGTDGLDIHYVEAGDANARHAVILIHGSVFNASTWDQTMDAFAPYGRVLAYDQLALRTEREGQDWRLERRDSLHDGEGSRTAFRTHGPTGHRTKPRSSAIPMAPCLPSLAAKRSSRADRCPGVERFGCLRLRKPSVLVGEPCRKSTTSAL